MFVWYGWGFGCGWGGVVCGCDVGGVWAGGCCWGRRVVGVLSLHACVGRGTHLEWVAQMVCMC